MKIFPLALLTLLLSTTAHASTAGGLNASGGDFAMVDTNNDGFISKYELAGMIKGSLDAQNEQTMSSLDKDGDGEISEEEYMSFYTNISNEPRVQESLKEKFNEIDSNKDNKLSADEMDTFRRGNLDNDVDDLFTLIDSNKDNKISQHEFDTFFGQMKELLKL